MRLSQMVMRLNSLLLTSQLTHTNSLSPLLQLEYLPTPRLQLHSLSLLLLTQLQLSSLSLLPTPQLQLHSLSLLRMTQLQLSSLPLLPTTQLQS